MTWALSPAPQEGGWAPFEWLSGSAQAAVVVAALALGLWATRRMIRIGKVMTDAGGPGIVPFEKAGDDASARRIMQSWQKEGRAAAVRHLKVDYAFIVGYALALAVPLSSAAGEVADRSWDRLAMVVRALAWAVLAAGALDMAENGLLLAELGHADDSANLDRPARWAKRAAVLKFRLLGAGGAFLVLVAFLVLPRRG